MRATSPFRVLPSRLLFRILDSRYARVTAGQAKTVTELFSQNTPALPHTTAQLAASQPCEDAHRVTTLRDGSTLVSMLDGHAGVHAVHFAQTTLTAQAVTQIESIETANALHGEADKKYVRANVSLSSALVSAFETTDKMFVDEVSRLGRPPKVVRTGACAMLVHLSRDQSQIHVANAGDCRAVVAREVEGGFEAHALSTDHNALTNDAEAQRLRDRHPGEHRLLVRGYVKGRVQMTRSIGDLYLKHADFNTPALGKTMIKEPYEPPYLSCTPEISSYSVRSNDKFLVVATDGLWSELENHEVVAIAAEAMSRNQCPARELAARALSEAALQEGLPVEALLRIPTGPIRKRIHDDITVTVIPLQNDTREEQAPESVVLKVVGVEGSTALVTGLGQEAEIPVTWLPDKVGAGDKVCFLALGPSGRSS